MKDEEPGGKEGSRVLIKYWSLVIGKYLQGEPHHHQRCIFQQVN